MPELFWYVGFSPLTSLSTCCLSSIEIFAPVFGPLYLLSSSVFNHVISNIAVSVERHWRFVQPGATVCYISHVLS